MDLPRFRQCVDILRQNDIGMIEATRAALEDQVATLLLEQENMSLEVKRTTVNAAKKLVSYNDRIEQIRVDELAKYQNGLRAQQQKGIQSKSALLLVARIVEKNREIDRIEKSIEETKMKASAKAKTLSRIINQAAAISQEAALLIDAKAVNDFLVTRKLTVGEVADYDLERTYRTFSLEV